MRASLVLIALFFLSLTTAFASDNARKAGAAAPAPALEASATPVSLRAIGMLRAAQWQQALTLSNELSRVLALPAGATRQQLEQLVFELFQESTVPVAVPAQPASSLATVSAPLAQLLATHTAEFQHLLAPVLPQASYDRYVTLLNTLDIRAK